MAVYRTEGSAMIAWLALGVALVALVISFWVLNRTAVPADTVVEEQATPLAQTARQLAARAEAQTRLAALRVQLAAEAGSEEAAAEIAEIRANLRGAYEDTEDQAQDEWRDLDNDLAALEAQVRDKSADAVATIERLLRLLERDIRTDED